MYILLLKEDTEDGLKFTLYICERGGKPCQNRQLKNYAGFLAIFNIA